MKPRRSAGRMPRLMPHAYETISDSPAEGPSIGECLDAYHTEHAHRRKAWTYYITETLNQFLNCLNIEENWPIRLLDKQHGKTYKSFLLDGSLTPKGRKKPGAVTIARKLGALHHFIK